MTPPQPVRFVFAFAPDYARVARPFGITPERAWVDVGPDELTARFGPWRLTTPLANLTAAQITGPYRFWRTAGSARLGVSDLSLTFATNGRQGVEIAFGHRVGGIEPLGILRHRLLTVTVADPLGLLALLGDRGVDA